MTYVLAWVILAICSGLLFQNRMEKATEKWGGLHAYLRLKAELKGESFEHLTEESDKTTWSLAFWTVTMIGWVVLLWHVVRSYFVDYEEFLENKLDLEDEE